MIQTDDYIEQGRSFNKRKSYYYPELNFKPDESEPEKEKQGFKRKLKSLLLGVAGAILILFLWTLLAIYNHTPANFMALVLGAFTGIVFTRKNHQNNFRITSGILAFAGSFAGVTAATLILLPFKLNTGFSELQSEIGLKIMIQSAVDTISTTDMIFITSSVLLALLLANIHYFAHLIHPKP